MSIYEEGIPIAEFLCGIHNAEARDLEDALHVRLLAKEIIEYLADADPEDPDVRSLLDSARRADRVAQAWITRRPIDLTTLRSTGIASASTQDTREAGA